MIHVLLLSLPLPEPPLELSRGNHGLFALFFRNYLRQIGETRFRVTTLPRQILDFCTDRALLHHIIELKPDVVGFSLYLWNSSRSMSLARRIREADPGIVLVGGGPEVQSDNRFIFSSAVFDFLIGGEGETTLYALLDFLDRSKSRKKSLTDAVREQSHRLVKLPSLYIRSGIRSGFQNEFLQKKNWRNFLLTDGVSKPASLSLLQKGITEIYTEYRVDDIAYLQIMRGCPFSCSFCTYGKDRRSIERLPLQDILLSIEKLLKEDVGEIYLLAPTLNYDAEFFQALLQGILKLRKMYPQSKTHFFAEFRPELLDFTDIDTMMQAGFTEFEVGIQTLNEKNQSRDRGDQETLQLLSAFLARGARPTIDFIVGLPEDSSERIIRTIDILERWGLLTHCVFYHLLVLPGSQIREQALTRGFSFLRTPPYQMLSTDTMKLSDIRSIYLYLEQEKSHSYFVEPVYFNPSVVFRVNAFNGIEQLLNSDSVKTASVIDTPSEFAREKLLAAVQSYVKQSPELFHHCYIRGSVPDRTYEQLKKTFRSARNYFDRYCLCLDFLNDELFSKRVTFLIDPVERDAEAQVSSCNARACEYAFVVSQTIMTDRKAKGKILSLTEATGAPLLILGSDENAPGHDFLDPLRNISFYFLPCFGGAGPEMEQKK